MQEKDVYAELASIRTLMERSSKFISLSGLSGILAGVYALAGARMAIRIITNHFEIGSPPENVQVIIWPLILIALLVVVLSAVTSYWLTARKARRRNENVWNPVSRRLLVASGIPFITGGLFISGLLVREEYSLIPAACLIFYGLALIAASEYTFTEVKWLGICQILLGLVATVLPGPIDGLIAWTVGFGLLHILYGFIMHFKYER
jgi:hypothetical protein